MDKSRKAGIQNKIKGSAKKIDNIKIAEENKSTTLRTSPVKINNPFKNKSPAQKRII